MMKRIIEINIAINETFYLLYKMYMLKSYYMSIVKKINKLYNSNIIRLGKSDK
ncbi:MAG: hypothetical protein K0S18_819 [Anaerocolumna sp.]|jgi:hypothetical protein|nr:hypothetical protein [Anaerocolumna sp.]